MDAWLSLLRGGWLYGVLPLLLGWLLDRIFGDPGRLPHPVVGFGKVIAAFERRLNHGRHRRLKGGFVSIGLTISVFGLIWVLLYVVRPWPIVRIMVETIGVFYCLAGTTLMREVRAVFRACDESLEAGRRQVGRIVGRDTASLSEREVKTAALETLAENLSDGVVAPLFWYMLLGLPGMMAYKMINTLDSMIAYRNERYGEFGYVAAHTDDIANYLPARLTALLLLIASYGSQNSTTIDSSAGIHTPVPQSGRALLGFVRRYGRCHASPNSGYPEAALAGILDCRFGGTHDYFGVPVEKPYIGETERALTASDMTLSINISRRAEFLMLLLTTISHL